MNHNNFKILWKEAHETQADNIITPETISALIHKPHIPIISKVMEELKLKILVYFISLFTLIGLAIYGFAYLNIQLSYSIGLPFFLAGLVLLFKLSSEVIRLIVLNCQRDDLTLKEANLYLSNKLRQIKLVDFYAHLILFYSIAIFFLFSYFCNNLKSWAQATNLSGLLITFVFLLLLMPWLIRKFDNHRFHKIINHLNKSKDYLDEEDA